MSTVTNPATLCTVFRAVSQVTLFMSLSALEQRFFKGSPAGMLSTLAFIASALVVPGLSIRVSYGRLGDDVCTECRVLLFCLPVRFLPLQLVYRVYDTLLLFVLSYDTSESKAIKYKYIRTTICCNADSCSSSLL